MVIKNTDLDWKSWFPSGEIRYLSTAQIGSARDYISLFTVFTNNIFHCEDIRVKTGEKIKNEKMQSLKTTSNSLTKELAQDSNPIRKV